MRSLPGRNRIQRHPADVQNDRLRPGQAFNQRCSHKDVSLWNWLVRELAQRLLGRMSASVRSQYFH